MDTTGRIAALRRTLDERGIGAALLMNPDNLFYISGFKALIYSRPILLIIEPNQTLLIIPALEEDHAAHEAAVDQLLVYYEHPEMAEYGASHLEYLDAVMKRMASGTRIGVELGQAPAATVDYLRGLGLEPVDIGGDIKRMRAIKTPDEIAAIRLAAGLVDLAVRESLAAIRPDVTEMEVDARGNAALFEAIAARHPGATVDITVMTPSGPERSVMPHVFSNTRRLAAGDVIIHSRQVGLNGYRAECERTCFLGRPTGECERAFKVMQEAQRAAMDRLRPGVAMMDVDRAAREVIRAGGFADYAIHRAGHAIGVSAHEEPYLRFDAEAPVEAGMVFSIEPGFYVPGLGGFRHSDTLVVTTAGAEIITNYPRELTDLVF
ncbi:MAG: M24 family metallopeptidase [Chloroflexota bacterium]